MPRARPGSAESALRERAMMHPVRLATTRQAAGERTSAGGPSLGLLLTEPARGLAGLATLTLVAPWLSIAPRGDGHGVLVLPGLLASDASTTVLRRYLRLLGYQVRGWALGRNVGPTTAVLDGLPAALSALAAETGGPVSVIGWSLGGIYARELARQQAPQVRQVITLGSPFALTDSRQSHADRAYQRRANIHASARVPGPGAAAAADLGPVDGGLLAAGRHRVLAGMHRAGVRRCTPTWKCAVRTSASASTRPRSG